ncbi:MAG: hypothetical protein M3Z85_09070 [Acidobacteriota bacterium]|nr:hypothetical protein [Acidobacteriota bacterium]
MIVMALPIMATSGPGAVEYGFGVAAGGAGAAAGEKVSLFRSGMNAISWV